MFGMSACICNTFVACVCLNHWRGAHTRVWVRVHVYVWMKKFTAYRYAILSHVSVHLLRS